MALDLSEHHWKGFVIRLALKRRRGPDAWDLLQARDNWSKKREEAFKRGMLRDLLEIMQRNFAWATDDWQRTYSAQDLREELSGLRRETEPPSDCPPNAQLFMRASLADAFFGVHQGSSAKMLEKFLSRAEPSESLSPKAQRASGLGSSELATCASDAGRVKLISAHFPYEELEPFPPGPPLGPPSREKLQAIANSPEFPENDLGDRQEPGPHGHWPCVFHVCLTPAVYCLANVASLTFLLARELLAPADLARLWADVTPTDLCTIAQQVARGDLRLLPDDVIFAADGRRYVSPGALHRVVVPVLLFLKRMFHAPDPMPIALKFARVMFDMTYAFAKLEEQRTFPDTSWTRAQLLEACKLIVTAKSRLAGDSEACANEAAMLLLAGGRVPLAPLLADIVSRPAPLALAPALMSLAPPDVKIERKGDARELERAIDEENARRSEERRARRSGAGLAATLAQEPAPPPEPPRQAAPPEKSKRLKKEAKAAKAARLAQQRAEAKQRESDAEFLKQTRAGFAPELLQGDVRIQPDCSEREEKKRAAATARRRRRDDKRAAQAALRAADRHDVAEAFGL